MQLSIHPVSIQQTKKENLAVPRLLPAAGRGRAMRSYATVSAGHALRLQSHTASIPHSERCDTASLTQVETRCIASLMHRISDVSRL
jgi:hypothetical protein